ncbi:GAF domain-containing protein [Paenibacillus sp. SI8]|uniref:GAF domain-containing protein n=1 Tax=unclassified Paenibacillus TaxID=185978 RepID=UPI003466DC91
MTDAGIQLMQALEGLRALTSSDFAALARLHDPQQRFRWTYVTGNQNDRNKHMTIKVGQGLSGSVLRFGRWAKLDDGSSDRDWARLECPLMLAEQLKTAAAFPIYLESAITGILFLGKRTQSVYQPDEIDHAQEAIPTFAMFLGQLIHEHVQ